MASSSPRLRILSVGGNAVSAFLSWRLQATNACDVTLVWKSGFDQVSQYGISMRSKVFGNERFKPRHVVRTPEDASALPGAFDYVLLCVKALPDVYDLATVIESVVTPQHTCILLNTTSTLGIEAQLEARFKTNVVLSLVSEADITQIGASEFEHHSSSEIWVGPANENPSIPAAIQSDMAEALAMTLASGQVDCRVSANIRQQQYERMIGAIAFYPASVLFETPSHADLIQKVGVRSLVGEIIDELVKLASRQRCHFADDFKGNVIENMTRSGSQSHSIMYQDFMARRPMEVETYLGMPVKLAQTLSLRVPRLETLYALLHHINHINQTRPPPGPASGSLPPPPPPPPPLGSGSYPARMSSGYPPRPMMNGHGPRPSRPSSAQAPLPPPPPGMRRGPPPPHMMNGYGPRPPPMSNGYPPPPLGTRGGGPPNPPSRRISADASDLEEFGHLMLYEHNIPEDEAVDGPHAKGPHPSSAGMNGSTSDITLRERELALRQREMALREQEFHMRRGGRRPPPSLHHAPPSGSQPAGFDDEDEDNYFDVASPRGPGPAPIDPDQLDMMSVTSRRTRKAPSAREIRKNPERAGGAFNGGGGGRSGMMRNRASARMMQDIPGLHESLMNNPLMGFSSNRYGAVDRKAMADESRTNSLTAARLEEFQHSGGPSSINGQQQQQQQHPLTRRTSQSPGNNMYGPGSRVPPHPQSGPPGVMMNHRRPSPPGQAQHNGYGGGGPNGYRHGPNGYGPPLPAAEGNTSVNVQNSFGNQPVNGSHAIQQGVNGINNEGYQR